MFNKKEIENLKEENKILKEQNKKLQLSYDKSKTKELREENDRLYNALENKCITIEELRDKIEKLEYKNIEVNGKLNDYRQEHSKLQKEKDDLQNKYNELYDKISLSNQEMCNLIEENEKLKQEILVKDKEIQVYIQAINNATLTIQKPDISKETKKVKKENK